jgi:hypothetical protein
MADSAVPEMSQLPADGSKAAVPLNSETRSTPEVAVPMLEVHAPHEPIHTWKSFFIHIATIVIGLLIAVGLEQTVEIFHHRHRVAEAREALHVERLSNAHRFAIATREFYRVVPNLQNNIATFRYLQLHPGAPADTWPARIDWSSLFANFSDVAWKSAQSSGVLEYMPEREVRQYGDLYARLQSLDTISRELREAFFDARKYAIAGDDVAHLTAQQLEREVELVTTVLARYANFVAGQRNIAELYPDFKPAPTRDDREWLFHDTFEPSRNKLVLDEINEWYRYERELGQPAPGADAAPPQ